MISLRANAIALFTGLSLLIHIDDAVPQACATMDTNYSGPIIYVQGSSTINWNWATTGLFSLNQNSNGSITGDLESRSSCTDPFNTTGAMDSNSGGFSLTSTDPSPSLGCTSTLNMSGSVSGAGCTVASGSWSNSSGQAGSFNMTHGCYVPTGETVPVFQTWGTVPPDTFPVAFFDQQLSPTTYNWGGRTVTETFPTNGNDTCWYQGSLIGKGGINHPSLQYKLASNHGYTDKLGLGTSNANYYRQHGRTPCGTTLYQTMVIDCPNPPGNQQSYATGTLFLGIGQRTVTDIRNNVPATEVWGTPAPALRIIDYLFNLFF